MFNVRLSQIYISVPCKYCSTDQLIYLFLVEIELENEKSIQLTNILDNFKENIAILPKTVPLMTHYRLVDQD